MVVKKLQKLKVNMLLSYLFKWALISLIIGVLIGTASAGFLFTLNLATNFRENHLWLIALLPIAGAIIGITYHRWGKDVSAGNNLLVDAIHQPKEIIPLKLAVFIYLGTLITHLFGGSAGREGTALQMAGSISDQFTKPFKLTNEERQTLIVAAIAGGFGSVFGTPLAGAIFGLEVFLIGRLRYGNILPAFATAVTADFVCKLWGVPHTHYQIDIVPSISFLHLTYAAMAGIAFGLAASLFSNALHWLSHQFKLYVTHSPLRPVIGGVIIALAVLAVGTTKYVGLGIPTVVASFEGPLPSYDFLLKIAFTIVTLAAGFKGGEVTPLFFIGATLGNALALFIPLPTAILAGMGFVAVFAGATNALLACIVMSAELFGINCIPYTVIACFVAFLVSGNKSIYDHPILYEAKFTKYQRLLKNRLADL